MGGPAEETTGNISLPATQCQQDGLARHAPSMLDMKRVLDVGCQVGVEGRSSPHVILPQRAERGRHPLRVQRPLSLPKGTGHGGRACGGLGGKPLLADATNHSRPQAEERLSERAPGSSTRPGGSGEVGENPSIPCRGSTSKTLPPAGPLQFPRASQARSAPWTGLPPDWSDVLEEGRDPSQEHGQPGSMPRPGVNATECKRKKELLAPAR